MAKQEQTTNGCCGDKLCAAKCSSMTNTGNSFFGTQQTTSLYFVRSTERFYVSDNVLSSHFLITQDRPPKRLS